MTVSSEQSSFANLFRTVTLPEVPRKGGALMPRRMVQFWDKTPPEDVQKLLDNNKAWAERNNIDYVFFNEEQARTYLTGKYVESYPLEDLFDKCFHPAMKADLFRLVYLYDYGGYYLDADNGIVNDTLRLFTQDKDLFFVDLAQMRVQNNYMIVRPQSALIQAVLHKAAHNIANNNDQTVGIGKLTGPYVFTTEVHRMLTDGSDYQCSLIDYLKNLHLAPGGQDVFGRKFAYKSSELNWQVAQAIPVMNELIERCKKPECAFKDYTELARLAFKFNREFEIVEQIAAQHWPQWKTIAEAIELRARLLVSLSLHQKAVSLLEERYQSGVKSAKMLEIWSSIIMQPKSMALAEKLAREAYSLAPNDAVVVAQLAAVLERQRKVEEARGLLEKVMEKFPYNKRLQLIKSRLDQPELLLEKYSDLIAAGTADASLLQRQFEEVSQAVMMCGGELKKLDQLAENVWDTLSLSPSCVLARAEMLMRMRRRGDAKSLLRSSYKKGVYDVPLLIKLSQVNMAPKRLPFSLAIAERALDEKPDNVECIAQFSAVQYALGRYVMCRETVNKALVKYPEHERLRSLDSQLRQLGK